MRIETRHLPRRGVGGTESPDGHRLVLAPWADLRGTIRDAFATLRPDAAPRIVWMATRHPVHVQRQALADRLLRRAVGQALPAATVLHVGATGADGRCDAVVVSDVTTVRVRDLADPSFAFWLLADPSGSPADIAAALSRFWPHRHRDRGRGPRPAHPAGTDRRLPVSLRGRLVADLFTGDPTRPP